MEISQRDKRALWAVGVALTLFASFRFAIFPAWDFLQEASANLPDRQKTLEKYREVIQAAELRRAEISSLEARLREAEAGLLASETPDLAFAEMQLLVQQLTAAQSIEIRSSAFLPVKPLEDDYLQVPLRLQFQCSLDQLASFLEEIGRGPKRLAISNLALQTANAREKLISVNMNVAGIMRPAATDGERPE